MSDQPPRKPRLDKHGNPPPVKKAAPETPAKAPMLDKYGNPPPVRRHSAPQRGAEPTPEVSKIVGPASDSVERQDDSSVGRANDLWARPSRPAPPVDLGRRTVPRPGAAKQPAPALPRRDAATFQPVYINPKVAGARSAGEWIAVLGVAIAVALLIKTYVVQAYEIPSESMVPTLMVKDKVVVNKLSYDYGSIQRGQIIVFKRPPGEPDTTIHDLIKRVIGLPGDQLEARNGVLYRNGQPVSEPYLPPGTITDTLPLTTVPQGDLFLMGDNRTNSEDSRFFGPVSQKLVVGKTEGRVWPLNRLHLF